MSLKFCTLLAALFVSLYSLPGLAASNPTLEAGINAFQSGKFDDAKQKFSELLKVPSWKFAALYNLGNTAVRQKHMGEALAYYVLALKRNPHDRDTQDNIKYVYSELGGRHLTAPLTNFQLLTENILDKFTFNEALAVTFIFSILALSILNSYVKKRVQTPPPDGDEASPNKNPPLRLILSFICLVIFVSFSILKLVDTYSQRGIVIAKTIGLRSGPNDTNASMADISEGSEVIIHDTDQSWVQVNVRGGSLLGWIPQNSIIITSGEGPEL